MNITPESFPNAPDDWDIETASTTAKADGINLSDDHWDLIRALQEYYHKVEFPKLRQVKDALEKGAHLTTGGKRLTDGPLEKGYFYAPTILTHVTREMLIYREETFGPVAPVIAYDPEDDVIEMANDTSYGLAAYVYTKSTSRAMTAFERLKFGIIGINDINPTSAAAPFGGMKESGMGREGAREGINEYLETKLGGFSI